MYVVRVIGSRQIKPRPVIENPELFLDIVPSSGIFYDSWGSYETEAFYLKVRLPFDISKKIKITRYWSYILETMDGGLRSGYSGEIMSIGYGANPAWFSILPSASIDGKKLSSYEQSITPEGEIIYLHSQKAGSNGIGRHRQHIRIGYKYV